MQSPSLFVCKSCHYPFSQDRSERQPSDGARLLDRLNTICADRSQPSDLKIQPVGCLWTCDHPCAVAFSAACKPTYLFTNLLTDETATALFEFGKLYLNSSTGDIPWKQFPEALQSANVAKIPAADEQHNGKDNWLPHD